MSIQAIGMLVLAAGLGVFAYCDETGQRPWWLFMCGVCLGAGGIMAFVDFMLWRELRRWR